MNVITRTAASILLLLLALTAPRAALAGVVHARRTVAEARRWTIHVGLAADVDTVIATARGGLAFLNATAGEVVARVVDAFGSRGRRFAPLSRAAAVAGLTGIAAGRTPTTLAARRAAA